MAVRKILIATDFSPPAAAALEQGRRLARLTNAEVVLVHVCDVVLPAVGPTPLESPGFYDLAAHRVDAARTHLRNLRNALSGEGFLASDHLVEGFADSAICAAAKEHDVDLVVVGTHGRTGFRRFLLGSVAERVVRLSDRPVFVARTAARTAAGAAARTAAGAAPEEMAGAPAATEAGGFRRILVPTDFAEASGAALSLALEFAAPDSVVELLHVLQPPALSFGPEELFATSAVELERWRQLSRADAEQRLAALVTARRDERPDVRLWTAIREGSPAAEVSRALDEGGHDLVVLGTHGRRGLERGLLGSVTEVTIRHAPCSALATHGAARSRAPQEGGQS